MSETSAKWEEHLALEMTMAARDQLDGGYVRSFYEDRANDYVWIAKQAIQDALARTGDFRDVPAADDVEAFRARLVAHFAGSGSQVDQAVASAIRDFEKDEVA